MLRLEGPSITVYSFILWVLSERIIVLWLFVANCDDLNLFYDIHYPILSALVSIFISILLQSCSEPFSFISYFSRKMHTERGSIVSLESNFEGWAESRRNAWGTGLSRLLPPWSITWRANVACQVAIAVISLFKLEVWKTLGKWCPFINYCKIIDGNRTIESTGQITDPNASQTLSLTKSLKRIWKYSYGIF